MRLSVYRCILHLLGAMLIWSGLRPSRWRRWGERTEILNSSLCHVDSHLNGRNIPACLRTKQKQCLCFCVRVRIEFMEHTEEERQSPGFQVYKWKVGQWNNPKLAVCRESPLQLFTLYLSKRAVYLASGPQPEWLGQRLGETDVTSSLWPKNYGLLLMAKGHR